MLSGNADNLPAGAFEQASLTLEFCFSGAINASSAEHTYIDNIQVTAAVPEPSSTSAVCLAFLDFAGFSADGLRAS